MTLDIHDTIVLTIHSNNNEITGRTTLQKLLYFQRVKIPTLIISAYKHHFYGPYNRDVASAIEDLTAFSLLDEKKFSGIYDTYHYSLSDSGKKYALQLKEKNESEFEKITNIVKICSDFCELKTKPLSFAAKAYYIMKSSKEGMEGKYTSTDVEKVAENFDWHITEEEIMTGVELLKKLELVNVS